jgi:hypothetical protein
MSRRYRLGIATLCVAVGVLAAIAAGLGVLARGDGVYETVTSARGEVYAVATSGVYAGNARQLVAEGVGWDVFTVLVAVPAMLAGAWLIARGSRHGALVTTGLLGYFAYMYLEYSVTWAFGPLFPLFVAITALSVVGLIANAGLLSTQTMQFDDRYPRRSWAALSLGMASLLTLLWAERIATGLRAGATPTLLGETTMTVQALDLGLVVPVSVLIAIAVWRRVPAGMVAGGAFGVTFAAMSFAIAAMMVSASIVTGVLQLPPIVMFGVAGVAAVVVVARMYTCAALDVAAGEPSELPSTPLAEPAVGRSSA